MPSIINETVGGSDTGATVGQNYRQQQVPFSRFQTRKVAFFRVGRADSQQSSGVLDLVAMNTMIDTIQTKAELVLVGAPYISNGWGKFIVAVFEDTFNNGSENEPLNNDGNPANYNDMSESLQTALRNAMDDGDINVRRIYMYGAPETGHEGYDGWTENAAQAEYDTKGQYEENSYVF